MNPTELTEKAVDALFHLIDLRKKTSALDGHLSDLGLHFQFFQFSSFLELNEDTLVEFLDWYFYVLLGSNSWHPACKIAGGLASYALYDAACPYIGKKAYYLRDRVKFEQYIKDFLKDQEKTNEPN